MECRQHPQSDAGRERIFCDLLTFLILSRRPELYCLLLIWPRILLVDQWDLLFPKENSRILKNSWLQLLWSRLIINLPWFMLSILWRPELSAICTLRQSLWELHKWNYSLNSCLIYFSIFMGSKSTILNFYFAQMFKGYDINWWRILPHVPHRWDWRYCIFSDIIFNLYTMAIDIHIEFIKMVRSQSIVCIQNIFLTVVALGDFRDRL